MVLVKKEFTFYVPVCYGLTNERLDQAEQTYNAHSIYWSSSNFPRGGETEWNFSNGRYIRAAIFDTALCRLLVFYPKI